MEQGQTVTAYHNGARFTGKLGKVNKRGEAVIHFGFGVDMILPIENIEPLNTIGPMTEEESAV